MKKQSAVLRKPEDIFMVDMASCLYRGMIMEGNKKKKKTGIGRTAELLMQQCSATSRQHAMNVRRYTRLLCLKFNHIFPTSTISQHDIEVICAGALILNMDQTCISEPMQKSDEMSCGSGSHTDAELLPVRKLCEIGRVTAHDEKILYDICMEHHERFDGTGYPNHLKGNEISLAAQIISLAETYDSLTEEEEGKRLPHEQAMQLLLQGKRGIFNPDLHICLQQMSDDLSMMHEVHRDEYRLALLEDAYSTSRLYYWIVKRFLDVSLSAIALVVLSPMLLLICLLIFLDDPKGSPIFKQVRVGRHKRLFTMYKFRTMVVNAEELKAQLMKQNEKDGPVFKIGEDPRVTRLGRFLRKTSLDELPQLINILQGHMSIVGPRPPLPSEVEKYSRYHEMRLRVTPGLTCIWQIQDKRDGIPFDQWMDMDVNYIGNRSIIKDFYIILLTIKCIFSRSGC